MEENKINTETTANEVQSTAVPSEKQYDVSVADSTLNGKLCPFCKTDIKEGEEVIICPSCNTPHHKGCWEENKGCTTFGCSEQHYEEQHTNPTDVCVKCGAPLGDGQEFCPKCGTPKGSEKKTICSKCGAELQEGQEFCPKCGQKADLHIDSGVNSAISQFNADVTKTNEKSKKKPFKIAIIVVTIIALAALTIFVAPKIFKSAEDYMALGDYEKAFSMTKGDEQENVKKENLVAYISGLCVDALKDSKSFELRDAWVKISDDSRVVVLKVAANNSYGNTVINYWYYSYDKDDNEYSLFTTLTDLDDETYYSWTDSSEKIEIILKNACRSTIKGYLSDSSTFVDDTSIDRINKLFTDKILDDVTLISDNK